MKQNDLEKLFRERLQADRPDVDTDRLWSALDGHLPGEQKRRPPIFWWLSGLTGLLLLLGGMWLGKVFFHEKNDPADQALTSETLEGSSADTGIQAAIGHTESQQTDPGQAVIDLPDPEKEEMGERQQMPASPATTDQEQSIADRSPDYKKADEAVKTTGTEETATASKRASDPGIAAAEKPVSKSSNGSTVPGQKAEDPPVTVSSTTPKERNRTETIPNAEELTVLSASDETSLEDALVGTTGIEGRTVQALPILERSILPESIRLAGQEIALLKNDELPVILKNPGRRTYRHELGLSVGIGVTGRQLDDLTTLGTFEKDFRETTERVLENWSAALSYRYHLGKWYAEVGLSAGWFNEKVDAITVTTDSMTLDNVVIEQVMENGQVIEERRGQVTITETIESRLLNYPKLFHLQGSLGFGRSWTLGRNTSLLTATGILYSFYHGYYGTIALGPDRLYDLNRNEGNRFSDSGMQFGGYLSADIRREFASRWSANAGLRASLWPKGIANVNSPVQQRYQSYQLTLGISRHF